MKNPRNFNLFRIRKAAICIVFFCVLISMNACSIFREGTVRVAKAEGKQKGTYLIGHLQARDSFYDPFVVDNFTDMIKFELFRAGYRISNLDNTVMHDKDRNETANPNQPDGTGSDSELSGFSNISGEMKIPAEAEKGSQRILNSDEISILSKKISFDYFLQGSVAMNDNRKFIDREHNALLFLDVYNSSGKLVASVNYSVEGRALTEAKLLQRTCESIVNKLQGKEIPMWKSVYNRILGE